MNLRDAEFLFLDGQTTGMRPPRGQMLEFGWSLAALKDGAPVVSAQIFNLPEGAALERKISEITGLKPADLDGKPGPKAWFDEVFTPWVEHSRPPVAVVHCAQFEKPFLQDLMQPKFDFICTQQLTRRLFPDLPSQNLRAVSGYFGHPVTGPNRAGDFTLATVAIWHGLASKLAELGIETLEQLNAWLAEDKPKTPKKRSISYRIPSALRLSLPDQPGIYKMFSKAGEVLYVGKATSLKSRVNSYFRGLKNRDRRKLEMLAQVWDLKVEVCGSPLEAALRETDEIKRFDPRYNVSLKKNQRQLCFYSRDFHRSAPEQSVEFPLGPFRPGGNIEMVQALYRSVANRCFEQIFWDPIEDSILEGGWKIFIELNPRMKLGSMRSFLAYGLGLHRKYVEPEEEAETQQDSGVEEKEEIEVTPDYVAGKFERLLRRAGAEIWRARLFNHVLNCDIEFRAGESLRRLEFRNGMYNSLAQEVSLRKRFPWSGLDIETYDRLSVLLSELSRLEHRILRHNPIL